MNLEEQQSMSHGLTFLFFMFVDISCLKILEKKTIKRDRKFLVSEFILNANLINKIRRFYFLNVFLGGLKFLNPTPLKRGKA